MIVVDLAVALLLGIGVGSSAPVEQVASACEDVVAVESTVTCTAVNSVVEDSTVVVS